MLVQTLRYLTLLVLTLLVLSLFSFLLVYLFPGDPVTNLSGIRDIDAGLQAELVAKYRLESNYFTQYIEYMALLFVGDWGLSFSSGLPLSEEVSRALPATLELACYALILSLSVGIPLGFIAAIRYHRVTDYSLQSVSAVAYSIPSFWLALIFILFFCLQLGLFPLSGRISLLFDIPHNSGFILFDIWTSDMANKQQAFNSALQHLVLPTLSIAVLTTAIIVRITRRSLLDVLSQQYVKAAQTRGLTAYQIFFRHGLRNALVPILPLLAGQVTILFTNAMIIETIFSWPGIGNWLIQAIYQRDYPAIRAGMLAVSGAVIIITVLIEWVARLLDPSKQKATHGTI